MVALAALVLAAAVAFLTVSHLLTEGPKTRVGVVGDSLTAQATWPIIDQLDADGFDVTVAGENGATIADQLRQLESLTLPGGAEIVVVALGTNNAFFASATDSRRRSLDQSRTDAHDALTRLLDGQPGQSWHPSTRCVVWVNVNDHSPFMSLDRNGSAMNKVIEDEAGSFRAKGRNVVVADWAGTSRNRPEWFLQDQVHLTPAGERAYADMIRGATHRCSSR